MSRQRIIDLRRPRTIGIIAAGALATTAVVAATWTAGSSGSPATLASQAHAPATAPLLALTGPLVRSQRAGHATQLRDTPAQLAASHWAAARAHTRTAAAASTATTSTATAPHAPAVASIVKAASSATPTATATATATAQPTAKASPSTAPASKASTSTAKVAAGSPQQIAKTMLASFGWSSAQFACLQPLWAHESGWSVTAYNAGTGAYGIPQAVPGSKMASAGPNWQTSATTQIKWGLTYIKGTYGSPCGAWSHEQATGWY